MASAQVEIEVDLPEGVRIRGYERHQASHVFEVDFDLPERFTCSHCRQEAETNVRFKSEVLAIRDLDLFGQPSFWVYQPALHQCPNPRCHQRTQLPTPFKRFKAGHTYRFEQYVMECLVGNPVEDVARRLSISAEMVESILEHQLEGQQTIPPEARITSLGFDELSLKKRHKLYVTVMTDLSDRKHPRVLAVVKGRDKEATEKCLAMLTREQREGVGSHRTDMSASYPEVCARWLPNSQAVIDRFHVAQKLGHVVDGVRKKRVVLS